MNELAEYVVKSGISLTVLYLFYWLFLQRDTHFRLNRVVLMFSLLVSMFLPLLDTGLIKTSMVLNNLPAMAIDFFSKPQQAVHQAISASENFPAINESAAPITETPVNSRKILLIIYISGALIVVARLLYQAIFLHAVAKLSVKTRHKGYTIVSMNSEMVPFSYFNRIFIPAGRAEKGSLDSIIAHEKSHLSQWHYIDLFVVEIISTLQWFNPVVWLYEKSIKEVHEYLADEAVLVSGDNPGRYQALLVNQAMGGPVFILTNQFNQSLIKKRITMMKKMRNSRVAQLKALLIVPLMAGLLLAFANPQMKTSAVSEGDGVTVTGNVTDRSTGNNLPGSIILIKGTTNGTVTNPDGSYRIITKSAEDILVFSHTGYRAQEVPVGTNSRINVMLEQDLLVIDFTQGNKLVAGENSNQNKNSDSDKENTFVVSEKLPSYPGGTDALLKFLTSNLKYPAEDKMKSIEGKVLVSFIVDEQGRVTNAKVLLGVSYEIDREALRLTNLMKGWLPASQNGHVYAMAVTMPIEFRIK